MIQEQKLLKTQNKTKQHKKSEDKIMVAGIKEKRIQQHEDLLHKKAAKEIQDKIDAVQESKKELFGVQKSQKVITRLEELEFEEANLRKELEEANSLIESENPKTKQNREKKEENKKDRRSKKD